jgi:hypothetical protein
MARPIWLESRRPARRRPARDVLAGLGAVLILLLLLIGVPAALLAAAGSPIPRAMPAPSLLTHRLDILATLKILSVVVWLAWLQLVACLITEVRAAVRNTGMPPRVPLAGGIQPAVHRLVTAVLLLFSGATALSPAFTHQPPAVTSAPPAGPAARPRRPPRRSPGAPGRADCGRTGPGRRAHHRQRAGAGARSPPGTAGREDLRGPAAGGQVPRKPVGDRAEPSR